MACRVVFVLGAALAAVGEPAARKGLAIGLLAAGSLIVGLETAPLLLALGALAIIEWIKEAPSSSGRLVG
jgi:ABC-type phosphate transport system permease subunit